MASYPVNGKIAMVTGAARGIGFGTAQELTKRGATVVVVDLDQGAADDAAERLGPEAMGIGCDVTDEGAMRQAVAATVERYGRLDIVMANAGIASRAATVNAMSGEAAERVLDVNLMGVWRTVNAALPEIIRNRGHVVVVASIYAFANGVGTAPYAMAKAGVEQLGRALRIELAQHGAGASVAYCGFIDTEMVRIGIDEDPAAERVRKITPKVLQKRLQPSQAGKGVVDGIEKRAPRIIRPHRWVVFSLLRGILNPILDTAMARDEDTQAFVRELDARGDQEQPTTA
jgi:NAD(P)-dependent dehydrogenase (short-subunit alcohol dehydrogenase family)